MKKQFQSAGVLAVSFGHLMHDIYSSFLAPMLPLLINKLGISLSMAGLLDVIRNSPALFNPFIGLIADRICVRYFVIFTPGITAVVMCLLGIAPGYGVAAIMMFIMGISGTLFHIPAPVIVKNFSGSKTGRGMSYYMLGGELSRTLGPLIITAAITIWGLEGSWRLIPFGLISSLILFIKLKDYEKPVNGKSHKQKITVSFAARKLIPLLSAIAGYNLFMMAMKVSVTLYLPAYIVSQGKTLMSASLLLAVLQLSGAAGTLFAGSLSDKIGRKTTLYISGTACPLLMWLFLVSGDGFAIPLLAALGFFLFASGPVILALVQDTGTALPSFANGLYMTVNFLVRSAVVFLVGYFADKSGFEITYKFTALWAIGVLPFIFLIPEEKRKTKLIGEGNY